MTSLRSGPTARSNSRTRLIGLTTIFALIGPAVASANNDSFDIAEYDAVLNAEHFRRAPGHDLTVRRVVSAETDDESGVVVVWSYTMVLDCKRPEVLSTTRCDPCEYPISEWVRRPTNTWFIEKSWPRGSSVMRARALRRIEHFDNYFRIRPMEGREYRGLVYQFWAFEGRRPSPAEVRQPPPPEPPPGLDVEPPKEWEEVVEVEIRFGDSIPEKIVTPVGERTVRLEARGYTKKDGTRRLTEDFWPFWSSDCGTFSAASGANARRTMFRLDGTSDSCEVYLYEARTGERRMVVVEPGREPPPPVRVAITFEGGRQADGVVLSGSGRWVDIEAHAYNPEGERILGFEPQWSVDGGSVEYLDDDKRVLRVHVDAGARRALVRARHAESGADATFEIKRAD